MHRAASFGLKAGECLRELRADFVGLQVVRSRAPGGEMNILAKDFLLTDARWLPCAPRRAVVATAARSAR